MIIADRAEPAAATLATLVEGVVAGALARVALWPRVRDKALESLAEEAGCALLDGAGHPAYLPFSAPHLLVLPGGALLSPGWPATLEAEARRIGLPGPESIWIMPDSGGFSMPIVRVLARIQGRVPLRSGLVMPRAMLAPESLCPEGLAGRPRVIVPRLTVSRFQR